MNTETTNLYFLDNDEIACIDCMGNTARHSGVTISGRKVEKLTTLDRADIAAAGFTARCETCGKL